MKEKQWDEESLQYWTWHVGDYWKILNIKDTSQVIGYCLVCPVDYEHPGVEETHHRHWYLFSDTPPVHWTLFNGDLTETPWLGHNGVASEFKIDIDGQILTRSAEHAGI